MKFSLLIPTRDRLNGLGRLLGSIYRFTHQKKNIEILIACDECDPASQAKVKELQNKYSSTIDIQMHVRQRTEMLNEDYYNWLGKRATGDMMWVLADDLELTVPGWDKIVSEQVQNFFNKYPDKVVCCHILDNTPPPSHRLPKFPCFPMFSREAMKATGGWLLHPKVPNWGADYVSYCIYEPIGRILSFIDRNYINHISWHNKQVEIDATNQRIGNIFNRLKGIPHHNTDRIIGEEVPKIRLDIKQYIKDHSQV